MENKNQIFKLNILNIMSKKQEAFDRNKVWAQLTPQQQLSSLDERLGKRVGAKKQRARIQYSVDNPHIEIQKEKKLKKRGKNKRK